MGEKNERKKRQGRIHSYACICAVLTSYTAILKRGVINGSVHHEFRKNPNNL